MGRSPCCSKEGLNRGAWTAMEDKILTSYIRVHGEGKWRNLPKRAGLKRCGKSCRLRWLNYLRPDIKRGNISHDEEELIIRLHKLLGNRWSLIAGRLPGRTDNEIKNYWNTTLGKKAQSRSSEESFQSKSRLKKQASVPKTAEKPSNSPLTGPTNKIQVIRTKATRCSKALVPLIHPPPSTDQIDTTKSSTTVDTLQPQYHRSYLIDHTQDSSNPKVHHGPEDFHEMYTCAYESGFSNFGCNDDAKVESASFNNNLFLEAYQSLSFDEPTMKCWNTNFMEENATMNLDSLAFLLDPEEWP